MSEPNLDYDPLVSAIYQVQMQLGPALDAIETVAQSLSGADADPDPGRRKSLIYKGFLFL